MKTNLIFNPSLQVIEANQILTTCTSPLFHLSCCRTSFAEFQRTAYKSFCSLPPDPYDISYQAANLIIERLHSVGDKTREEDLLAFRTSSNVNQALQEHGFNKYISEKEVRSLRCRRFRAIARFQLSLERRGWQIRRDLAVRSFSQSTLDYRSSPRSFSPMSEDVADNDFLKRLLIDLAVIVRTLSSADQLSVTVHQVRGTTTLRSEGNNSPEGIHRDGFSFVVPALIVRRRCIEGGISRVFAPDGVSLLYSSCLDEGGALLHADDNTSFMHDATPFYLSANGSNIGIRDILGFDLDPQM